MAFILCRFNILMFHLICGILLRGLLGPVVPSGEAIWSIDDIRTFEIIFGLKHRYSLVIFL